MKTAGRNSPGLCGNSYCELGQILAQLPSDAECCFDWIRRIEGFLDAWTGGHRRELAEFRCSAAAGKTFEFCPIGNCAEHGRRPTGCELPSGCRGEALRERSWPTSFVTTPTGRAHANCISPADILQDIFLYKLTAAQLQGNRSREGCHLDLLNRLELDLRGLIDLLAPAQLVPLQRAMDLFGGQPPRNLPDLLVEWNARHFPCCAYYRDAAAAGWHSAITASRASLPQRDRRLHERGKQKEVMVPNLAPTFLKLLVPFIFSAEPALVHFAT